MTCTGRDRRFAGLAALTLCLSTLTPDSAMTMTDPEVEELLDKAAELHVRAPWHESQEILEQLRPFIDEADIDRYARFTIMEARNRVLAGHMNDGLDQLESLLTLDLPLPRRIRTLALAANINLVLRRYEETFDQLGQALELVSDPAGKAYSAGVYSLAANLYAQVDQFHRARHYGHLGVEAANAHAGPRLACVSFQRLAFVYKSADIYGLGLRHYRTALEHCRRSGDDVLISVTQYSLADLLREAGHYEEAASHFRESMQRLETTEYASGLAEGRLYEARLHHVLDEHEQAETLLIATLEHFERHQVWNYLAEAHGLLADIRGQRNDHEGAVEHILAQIEAREAHLGLDRARRLAFLEVDFDTRFKESELALLREQARVTALQQQTRRQQRQLQQLGYIVAAFLVPVLALLLFHAVRERRHYRRLARHDGLTGLLNHTHFFRLAAEEMCRTEHEGMPFVLVLADIDHFKRVNDRHGHIAGDRTLVHVASRLRESFAGHGIVGRVGGEEFGIALAGTRMADVVELLERLRHNLSLPRPEDDKVKVTMSFGLAGRTGGGTTINALREEADRALYEAKRLGRDTIVCHDPKQPVSGK